MKKLSLAFLALGFSLTLVGQNFPELYLISDSRISSNHYHQIVTKPNSTITVMHQSRDSISDALSLTNINFCNNGNYKAFLYSFNGPPVVYPEGTVVDSKGHYYINGRFFGLNGSWGHPVSFMMKVNQDFSPAWCYYFDESFPIYTSHLTINSKDELLVTGDAFLDSGTASFILKIDTLGNFIQNIAFNNLGFDEHTSLATSDGGWFFATPEHIIKLDSNLTQEWIYTLNEELPIGVTPTETSNGYFFSIKPSPSDPSTIGVFIDKTGKYKWNTGVLSNHYLGQPLAKDDSTLILQTLEYGNSPNGFGKLSTFTYDTDGNLKSRLAYSQSNGFTNPLNSPSNFITHGDILFFSQAIAWRSSMTFKPITAIGLLPLSAKSNCLQFDNSQPTILPYSLKIKPTPTTSPSNFFINTQSLTVTVAPYFHDSILQLCPHPYISQPLNIPDTIPICNGDSTRVYGLKTGNHLWSTGDTDNYIVVSSEGQYFVKISDPCGKIIEQDSFYVKIFDPTPIIIFGDSTSHTFNEVLFTTNLQCPVKWYVDGSFIRQDSSLSYNFSKPGTYHMRADYFDNNQVCRTTAGFTIEVLSNELFFPNVFTPNGDGVNDVFKSVELYHKPYSISVYSRNGNKIVTTTEQGWDGRASNNQPVADGVYFYVVSFPDESRIIKGHITIIR
ncbi:gliding motility-associated C-terminal domain-containing protein [Owenweeksia hongkongensis]|uniref:T9SS type B sorting domain-containing protein n=1 Tax=Owenweeksia hongkongensis TaxID=253245 RepID=UPI003A90ECC7